MTVGREVPEDGRRKAGEARQGARRRRSRPLPAEWQDPGWVRRRSGHTQGDARQVGAGQEARRAKARQGRGDAGAPRGGRTPQGREASSKRRRPPSSPRAKPRREDVTGGREGGGHPVRTVCRLPVVPRPGPCDWPGRVSWAGRPGPAASQGGTDEAVLWAHLGRPHDTVTALGARRRHDAARGAQARARAGRAGVADPMRRDLPSPAPTTRPVGGVPHLRTGQDGPAWLRRATCAHGAGPGPPRAHGGRPADRRARAIPGARLRRARRDLSFGLRQPARTRGDGRPGARREAARRRDGTPPRRRRRRAVPRHVRGRDVPPSWPRRPQGGATRISRVRRGMPRPPSPALHDRLPHP